MSEDKKPEAGTSFPQMEGEVFAFWQQAKTFEKSLERQAPLGDYVFYDGPPFATGTPHYGHIVGQLMKDVVPRYYTMKGYRVERKWGWDCHGLPIENIVEKEMGTKSKKDIEDMGVAKFNSACRSKVLDYAEEWYRTANKLGRWVDMNNPYRTMDLNFMESVWWVFKGLWDKGLIYKDYRSMHICPRCETTLSQSEVTEGYKDIKDLSCVAKFELQDEPGTFVLAWTTTPWTLIGNVALAVGAEIVYAKVKMEDGIYILAKERLAEVLKEKSYEILGELKGSDLEGKSYKPLFPYYEKDESLPNRPNGWKIYSAAFVTTVDGTGVVHIAPAFGEDDMNLGKERSLPFIQHVGLDGNFKAEVLDFAGLNVKPIDDHTKTDVEIIKYLAAKGLLFDKAKYEHSYPHCWRCDTPLLNYATSSWFVSVTKIKEKLLESAKHINWSPEHIKEGRFGNWLEGARDWSISRQRFWASAIPIWECACGERKVIGSVKELEELSGKKVDDIHKDVVDEISFPCPSCGGQMKRVPDVLDCWFESGSMPYAQIHYPFENEERFEKTFPAEFIAEGADQTRAWFYYLHVIAGGLKDSHAFKNVIVNGIVLAEDGKKMSKKLKNYPDPMLILDKYGADALRAYLLSSPVMQAENLNFSEKGVAESLRKNVMLLWNVYRFYEMYAPEFKEEIESREVLDLWIVNKLNQLIKEVTEAMEHYNLPRAMRPISDFMDELSTWYLRRSRDRFKGEDETDKQKALATTKRVLLSLSRVLAPFMPFIAENLFQKVSGLNFQDENRSVHLESWPQAEAVNEEVLAEMELVRKVVELGLAKRDEAGIKVRQVLGVLKVWGGGVEKISPAHLELIKDEINIKELQIISNEAKEISLELDVNITPELKREGIKREAVRFINMARKDLNFTINDQVSLQYETDSFEVQEVFKVFGEEIKREVLAKELELVSGLESKELDLNGEKFKFQISRA